ncbi:hypothetical protein SAMN06295912_1168 [Sphingomonas laterariae]|uniref:Calcineurin-like phosphoesterase domain-containing protein n=1 Tax=Edaphosphingomonas laterariae TaxID=861865 RepID=A0A239H9U6_9SPHN|nr:metallophosphoesterase [Sphingomonas laterariae]SNS78169.1 hypothetical protein SAMN06295912_1168 [Sphingomonas laterariae]
MRFWHIASSAIALGVAVIGWCYWTAITDPIVRQADVPLLPPDSGLPPLRLLLISDIHVAGPDMTPTRLSRIVGQINALHPDAVLIAGDLVSDKRIATRTFSLRDAIAPLGRLKTRLGAFAVLGNHDHWRDADEARYELARAGVHVLDNNAAQAGPLVIGGIDDAFTGNDDLPATLRSMAAMKGTPILISHSPDPFPDVPPSIGLMVAGHTHCGQIRLPLVGALSYMSAYGDRYACGHIREASKQLIVGAGLGTSLLPLRLGAVPDMWMITIRPRDRIEN